MTYNVKNLQELSDLVYEVGRLQTTDVNEEFNLEESTVEEELIEGHMVINYGDISCVCDGEDIFIARSMYYVPTTEVRSIISEWN